MKIYNPNSGWSIEKNIIEENAISQLSIEDFAYKIFGDLLLKVKQSNKNYKIILDLNSKFITINKIKRWENLLNSRGLEVLGISCYNSYMIIKAVENSAI